MIAKQLQKIQRISAVSAIKDKNYGFLEIFSLPELSHSAKIIFFRTEFDEINTNIYYLGIGNGRSFRLNWKMILFIFRSIFKSQSKFQLGVNCKKYSKQKKSLPLTLDFFQIAIIERFSEKNGRDWIRTPMLAVTECIVRRH